MAGARQVASVTPADASPPTRLTHPVIGTTFPRLLKMIFVRADDTAPASCWAPPTHCRRPMTRRPYPLTALTRLMRSIMGAASESGPGTGRPTVRRYPVSGVAVAVQPCAPNHSSAGAHRSL